MRTPRLEPGILPIFRIFLVLQLGLILVNVGAHPARGMPEGSPWGAVAFGAVSILLLLGYLSWPILPGKLGRFHLPIALAVAAILSLAAQDLFLISAAGGGSEESAWQLFLFLFIPLVLSAWQYGFGAVIAYCSFTTLLDFVLTAGFNPDYAQFQAAFPRLLLIRFVSFLLVGYIVSRIMAQLRRQRQALESANRKLASYLSTLETLTVIRERNRLARELHDTLAHTLSGIAVELEAVNSLWDADRDRARGILGRSLQATRSGLSETRRSIQALRATPVEDLGLAQALRQYAESAAGGTGMHLELILPPAFSGLPPEVEQCFYRIGQEALENVLRHANAKSLHLSLEGSKAGLSMEIRDDGIGFDPQNLPPGSHFGLQGMRERAELIHADLAIESRTGEGTRLILQWEKGNPAPEAPE
jgi:signal transduction histidine kinase